MYGVIIDYINRCMYDWGFIVVIYKLIIVIKVLVFKIS